MPAAGRPRHGGTPARSGAATTADLASYIEDMVREMERLAGRPELGTLRDLLRKAREEASRHAQE